MREIILHDPVSASEVETRVQSMLERGAPYGTVPKRFLGDPRHDTRYEKKYAELNAAAYGLGAAGFTGLDFDPGESPDFTVRRNNVVLSYLEVVRVVEDEQAEYDGLLTQVNVALRRRAEADLEFAAHIQEFFCEIILPEPPLKKTRDTVVAEVVDLFATMPAAPERATIADVPVRYPLLRAANAKYIALPSRGISHVAFREPAKSFDDLSIAKLVLARLIEKRKRAGKYTGSPLWIMMYCEEPGIDGALHRLADVELEMRPFSRVFIGGQRRIFELRDTPSTG